MITIFIPVHNEEKIIERNTRKLIDFLDKKKISYEIFFGNNGSIDSTLDKIRIIQKRHPDKIRYNSCEKRGIGSSFRELIKKGNFNNIVTVDIDLSHDLNFISKSKELLKQGYDVIIGYKSGFTRDREWYRKLFTLINIKMCRFFLGLKYKDYGAGAKAYSKTFLKERWRLIDQKSFFVTKLLFYAKKESLNVKQIPVICNDTRRKSRCNVFTLPIYISINIIKLSLLRK